MSIITDFQELFEGKYKMTEARFWQLVGLANWPHDGYDGPNAMYLTAMSKDEGIEFRNLVDEAKNVVNEAIGPERNPAQGGDDSHSDFCFHIVGLGKDQFYAHLNDYSLMEARGKARDYRESFGYAVPYKGDWEENDGETKEYSHEDIDAILDGKKKDENVLDYATVIDHISDCLQEADEDFVAHIYNQVCSGNIEEAGDGNWKVIENA